MSAAYFPISGFPLSYGGGLSIQPSIQPSTQSSIQFSMRCRDAVPTLPGDSGGGDVATAPIKKGRLPRRPFRLSSAEAMCYETNTDQKDDERLRLKRFSE